VAGWASTRLDLRLVAGTGCGEQPPAAELEVPANGAVSLAANSSDLHFFDLRRRLCKLLFLPLPKVILSSKFSFIVFLAGYKLCI
jgi:hypothetical protein